MTTQFVARGKGRNLPSITDDPAARQALVQARLIIGVRALVRREPKGPEPCVVVRAEQLTSGRRYEREYGRGPTWAVALHRAREEYRAIRERAAGRRASS